MAVSGFNQVLQTMAQADFFTGVLPFVITYVVFFFALKKVKIFDNGNEKVAGIVAIAAAFYVARFITLNAFYQEFFVQYFGTLTIGIIGILGLLVVLAMVGWDINNMPGQGGVFGWLLAGIAVAAFTVSGGVSAFIPGISSSQFGGVISQASSLIFDQGLIWVLLVVAALWWTTSDDNSSSGEGEDGRDLLNKLLWNANSSDEESGG